MQECDSRVFSFVLCVRGEGVVLACELDTPTEVHTNSCALECGGRRKGRPWVSILRHLSPFLSEPMFSHWPETPPSRLDEQLPTPQASPASISRPTITGIMHASYQMDMAAIGTQVLDLLSKCFTDGVVPSPDLLFLTGLCSTERRTHGRVRIGSHWIAAFCMNVIMGTVM